MKLELPTSLVDCIARTKVVLHRKVSSERSWLYCSAPPESFNAMVADHITILRAQYGFDPCEHSDWVQPEVCYTKAFPGEKHSTHPLNSWLLKDPVSFVPSFKHLREQFEWYEEYVLFSKNKVPALTAEEVQDSYVVKACEDFASYASLLSLWRNYGSPRDQWECTIGLNHRQVKKVQAYQHHNVLTAKIIMDGFESLYAPRFLKVQAMGAHAKEVAIHDQFYKMG